MYRMNGPDTQLASLLNFAYKLIQEHLYHVSVDRVSIEEDLN